LYEKGRDDSGLLREFCKGGEKRPDDLVTSIGARRRPKKGTPLWEEETGEKGSQRFKNPKGNKFVETKKGGGTSVSQRYTS